ncbi:MAG: citramalate synthase, partial [Candidatus Krumholzibacteria bacterium]|nr:citramalate synthase [Candidatus Krumholzibacteria bacterium]
MKNIELYDTTLRDGAQTEGISYSVYDKVRIARKLDELGIHYVEGGYPLSNPKDKAFFVELKKKPLKNARLVAFGSTRRGGVDPKADAGLKSLVASGARTATIFGKSSDLHVCEVLQVSLDENLEMIRDSVGFLRKKGLEVIYDAEHFFDGYKANAKFAMQVLQAADDAGADALVLCETNGGCLPSEVYEITKKVCKKFKKATVGIHTHNDSDCAVANALAAVSAGATHVQGTVNGLGERTGNANLCTIIPNLVHKMGYETIAKDKLEGLTELSRYVFEIANLSPVMNMPYVGESAFAHKGGLHIDALRKNKKTYEHIAPELVGNERRFLISELSGSSSILAKLEKKKLVKDKAVAQKILKIVQDLENQGYQFEAAEASFDILVKKALGTYKPSFELEKYHIDVERDTEGRIVTEATVKLRVDGVVEHVVSEGDGPVNA